MMKKYIKLLCICTLACMIFTSNVAYARLIGKNNNKNDWVGKINASMDKIANHFVDSVIQDNIDEEKYNENETESEIQLDNEGKKVATLSCATISCATLSNIADKQ